jgi:putative NADH-flavin reductase
MRLTIFAATGGIGRLLLEQAVDAGHEVTAVARRPQNLSRPVRAVTADLSDPDPVALADAVVGSDAVLSGLGASSVKDAGIAARGTRGIVDAMQRTGVRRIVVVSAAPVGAVASPGRPNPPRYDPGDGFFMRHLFGPLITAAIRPVYQDHALMEDLLRESGLDWTSVRPPRLTNGRLTGRYRVAYGQNVRRGVLISRADVAHLMLRAIDDPDSVKQTVGLAN